ncbi:MAG: HAD family hydrolase [Trichlorobacter sp.]|jgi:3-deoxy-D-manno-octulosonate 8-phosphate phosphatase (KDO 8-P phosphatase)
MHEKLKHIELLLLDVDGVMTDGRIIWDAHGVETKAFNVKDGHGIKLLQRAGLQVGIITGRTSPVVDLRARELGIEILYQGALKKLDCYLAIKQRTGLDDHQIAFMGDDVIDVPVLRRVGFSAAPADALPEVAALVDYQARCSGGMGAVRELCDLVLKARGVWQELVAGRYEL